MAPYRCSQIILLYEYCAPYTLFSVMLDGLYESYVLGDMYLREHVISYLHTYMVLCGI
jgi:hypothetical protein